MAVAASLVEQRGLRTTLDLLAEDIPDSVTAMRNVDTYLQMVESAASDPRFARREDRPTVSMKLSSYTTDPLEDGGRAIGAAEAVRAIAEHAAARDVELTLDMESRHWTDFTLDLIDRLHGEGHRHVGAVLQTRLTRTRSDLDRLPDGVRVRLVIGIYQEPESVATTDKAVMKWRMLEYADLLLRRGHFVEFATHDEAVIRSFVDDVVPRTGAGTDRFEIQMLYGVPRERLLMELRGRGIAARLYVPFALGWPMAIAYLRRRLDEYPAMMWLVAKNLFRRR
jgi:proline dehydrogenase